jgi:F-type H+-transporting ATPase subunit b
MEFLAGLFEDPTFWVAVGTTIFVIVLIVLKVPGMLAKMLDERAAAIRGELDEAKRLREEAEALMREYLAKTTNAEGEAAAIIAAAKTEADRMTVEAGVQLKQQIERRAKMAEQKIAQAEAEAIDDVRKAATQAASAAAGEIIRAKMTDAKGDALIDAAIRDLRTKLH